MKLLIFCKFAILVILFLCSNNGANTRKVLAKTRHTEPFNLSLLFRFSQGISVIFSNDIQVNTCLPKAWAKNNMEHNFDLKYLKENIQPSITFWNQLKRHLKKNVEFACTNDELFKKLMVYYSDKLNTRRRRVFSHYSIDPPRLSSVTKKFFRENRDFLKRFTMNVRLGEEAGEIYAPFKGQPIVKIRFELYKIINGEVKLGLKKLNEIMTIMKIFFDSKIFRKIKRLVFCFQRKNNIAALKDFSNNLKNSLLLLRAPEKVRAGYLLSVLCNYKRLNALIQTLENYSKTQESNNDKKMFKLGRFMGQLMRVLAESVFRSKNK